jgi:dTDP-glucose 4,6-dehydratase
MGRTILITGGAGFIGSHVVRLFLNKYPDYLIVNADKLTYAGNLENLTDVESRPNYKFIRVDITSGQQINSLFHECRFDGIIHLAAESHVDRSITNPLEFINTNILGTVNLLNAAKEQWNGHYDNKVFYHISTDEVFGSLGNEGFFTESTPYDPRSPYSASKASSDHLVRAYYNTYGLPVLISNCSNNYGPNQFPEKLIPLSINNIKNNNPIPVYGTGENIRDWLYVEDHARAIETIFHGGRTGETYAIGGNSEWKNIELIHLLCRYMDEKLKRPVGESEKLIKFVTDRAGHDLRYAIDSTKLRHELGWEPSLTFKEGLKQTVDWYIANDAWLQHVVNGEYANYYERQYQQR